MPGLIQYYKDRFLMVSQCKDAKMKNIKLAEIMTEMEREYHIPMINDEEYNKTHTEVMELYREISSARVDIRREG